MLYHNQETDLLNFNFKVFYFNRETVKYTMSQYKLYRLYIMRNIMDFCNLFIQQVKDVFIFKIFTLELKLQDVAKYGKVEEKKAHCEL